MFVVGMIIRQAENAIVLEDLPVLPAISRGWEVFRANLGPIILMAIILAVIGVIVGIIIALPVLAIVVPAAITFAVKQSTELDSHDLRGGLPLSLHSSRVGAQRDHHGLYRIRMDSHLYAPDGQAAG